MKKEIKVKLIWDEGVWHSEIVDEKFCVTLEHGSFDALIERVKIAVQDILEIDFKYTGDIQFLFQTERVDNMMAKAV